MTYVVALALCGVTCRSSGAIKGAGIAKLLWIIQIQLPNLMHT